VECGAYSSGVSGKQKKSYSLRPLRLCGESKFVTIYPYDDLFGSGLSGLSRYIIQKTSQVKIKIDQTAKKIVNSLNKI
jgi:hypothetical protein